MILKDFFFKIKETSRLDINSLDYLTLQATHKSHTCKLEKELCISAEARRIYTAQCALRGGQEQLTEKNLPEGKERNQEGQTIGKKVLLNGRTKGCQTYLTKKCILLSEKGILLCLHSRICY